MGASYVAGTAPGAGMANNQRGPGNGRDYLVAKVSPHVVKAGIATMTSNAKIIDVSGLPNAAASYAIILSATDNNLAYADTKVNSSAGKFTTFTIHSAGASSVVAWSVISIGSGDNT